MAAVLRTVDPQRYCAFLTRGRHEVLLLPTYATQCSQSVPPARLLQKTTMYPAYANKSNSSDPSSVLNTSQNIAVAAAKIYHANFSAKENDWQYFNQRGTVIFGRDIELEDGFGEEKENPIPVASARYWFRLIDSSTGRVVWLFQIPEDCVYRVDRPFFHVFSGRSRMWGFLFDNDEEGLAFGRFVEARLPTPNRQSIPFTYRRAPSVCSRRVKSRAPSFSMSTPSLVTSNNYKPSGVSTDMISLPNTNSYVHVSHIGLNRDGVMEHSEGLDRGWTSALTRLQHHGGSRGAVKKHKIFAAGVDALKRLGPAAFRSGCF